MTSNHELKRMLGRNQMLLRLILRRIHYIMPTLDEILAKQAAALSAAGAETDLLTSIKTLLDADVAAIADLKQQLLDAGSDPAKLQQLSDNMDQLIAAADTRKAAEQAILGTGTV